MNIVFFVKHFRDFFRGVVIFSRALSAGAAAWLLLDDSDGFERIDDNRIGRFARNGSGMRDPAIQRLRQRNRQRAFIGPIRFFAAFPT